MYIRTAVLQHIAAISRAFHDIIFPTPALIFHSDSPLYLLPIICDSSLGLSFPPTRLYPCPFCQWLRVAQSVEAEMRTAFTNPPCLRSSPSPSKLANRQSTGWSYQSLRLGHPFNFSQSYCHLFFFPPPTPCWAAKILGMEEKNKKKQAAYLEKKETDKETLSEPLAPHKPRNQMETSKSSNFRFHKTK